LLVALRVRQRPSLRRQIPFPSSNRLLRRPVGSGFVGRVTRKLFAGSVCEFAIFASVNCYGRARQAPQTEILSPN
jgi:hypothetical protein